MSKCRPLQFAVIASAIFVAASAFRAEAAVYPGAHSTFSSGASNTKPLFTITGDTLNITGDPNGINTWSVDTGTGAKQIIGIRSVYLVNANGTAPAGITTVPNGGFIASSPTSPTHVAWTSITGNGFNIYDDGENGNGFGNSGKWLELAPPSLAGKTGTNALPFGSFTFSGPLLNPNGTAKYDLGLDVLFAGATGSTQRVYFTMPSLQPVPEASTFVLFALLIGSTFLYVRRKKATASVGA